MRFLIVTNFYPPFHFGGQELVCKDVVEALGQRGHQTAVLTSSYGSKYHVDYREGVYRLLDLEMTFTPLWKNIQTLVGHRLRNQRSMQHFDRLVDAFRPDIVFFWGMWNIDRCLPVYAERRLPEHVVYRLADYWPILPSQDILYWQHLPEKSWKRLIKKPISKLALKWLKLRPVCPAPAFARVICVSHSLKKELLSKGVSLQEARVINNGIDLDRFLKPCLGVADSVRGPQDELRLLYAGRLSQEKGLETLLKALALVRREQPQSLVHLTLIGSGDRPYVDSLHSLSETLAILDSVEFVPHIPREDIPAAMDSAHVFVFPAEWQEPFSRAILEAMARGLIVVGTATGGTSEVLQDGVTGLVFAPGQAQDLADKLITIYNDPGLGKQLAAAARNLVSVRFGFKEMVDQYEAYLAEMV